MISTILLILGCSFAGFTAGVLICNKLWENDIKYKAELGVGMLLKETMYKITKELKNEK